MSKDLIGMILGWILVTVTAWFAAFSLMGYALADINPIHWTTPERVIHLVLQGCFIAAYGYLTRPE